MVPSEAPSVDPEPSDPEPPEATRNPRLSRRNVRSTEDPAAVDRLRRRLSKSLAAHGTTAAKVERDPFTSGAYQRLDRALKARDLPQAEQALTELESSLANLEIDEDRLNQRLRKLAAELQQIPKAELKDLEDRYLELRSSLRPRMRPEELKALSARIAVFEREVRRVR